MNLYEQVDELVSLAKETESEYPIDWSELNMDKEGAYRLLATSLLEQFEEVTDKQVFLSVILALTVENFALNVKLLQ